VPDNLLPQAAKRLESPPAQTVNGEEDCCSVAEFANLCGFTSAHLYDLARKAIIPTPTRGKWPVIRTVQALFNHLKAELAAKHTGELAKAKVRVETARGEIYEAKVATAKEQAVSVAGARAPGRRIAAGVLVGQVLLMWRLATTPASSALFLLDLTDAAALGFPVHRAAPELSSGMWACFCPVTPRDRAFCCSAEGWAQRVGPTQ